MMRSIFTRNIWLLSFVSMFADMASEMLYPVVPVYLKEIGFSVLLIGVLEGLAEVTVGISKGYFGKLSDHRGERVPFIRFGYLLSAVSKPMMAAFTYPLWIFFARVTDRLGKGLRTAARDALLSAETTREHKARVFGFHRSWDTVGAIVGPVMALAWLNAHPGNYKPLFFYAFIPGIVAVAIISFIREKTQPMLVERKGGFFSFFGYWKEAVPDYRKLLTALTVFAIANSSDVFLMIRARELTGSDAVTISGYILYNIVFALMSLPIGYLADRIGMKKVFIAGLILFSIVYAGFAFGDSTAMVYVLFGIYGIYAASTEGIAKAWISNMADQKKTATALGLFNSVQSLATFLASTIAGLLWMAVGSRSMFLFSSILATMVGISLIFFMKSREKIPLKQA
ncbi:MAG TPA: MFS transporter [Flavitalea sp.]|nr:MFS transporter [Flavitalea sp.]